jgi:hypothetical protein
MSILDSILGQLASSPDIANLATKVGLTPEQVETAVTALAQAHTAPGDTVDTAADATGLPSDTLQQIVGHIGGEGSLSEFSNIINNQPGGIGGLLGSLGSMFGKS